ncbi:unnamed protein product [Mesocestoides corti]|uniref:Uncharacterized protein n=1 Tax=Mesocestoides corti TaxID=53468 RepID=A0A0R3UC62_MESCO|nr:unnamed protein product [Mesocestoides corti]
MVGVKLFNHRGPVCRPVKATWQDPIPPSPRLRSQLDKPHLWCLSLTSQPPPYPEKNRVYSRSTPPLTGTRKWSALSKSCECALQPAQTVRPLVKQ